MVTEVRGDIANPEPASAALKAGGVRVMVPAQTRDLNMCAIVY